MAPNSASREIFDALTLSKLLDTSFKGLWPQIGVIACFRLGQKCFMLYGSPIPLWTFPQTPLSHESNVPNWLMQSSTKIATLVTFNPSLASSSHRLLELVIYQCSPKLIEFEQHSNCYETTILVRWFNYILKHFSIFQSKLYLFVTLFSFRSSCILDSLRFKGYQHFWILQKAIIYYSQLYGYVVSKLFFFQS